MPRAGPSPLLLLLATVLLAWTKSAAAPRPLAVSGYQPATLLRASRPGPRPLVVGLHGNFDRPEWFCSSLEPLLEGRAHGLCPRGKPRTDVPRQLDRWTFPARGQVRAEIDAGIKTLRRQRGIVIAEGPVLLAGFSLGAIIASRFAVEFPARFPRLYMVEGGQAVWSDAALRRFAKLGGRGLVFGCGHAGCGARSQQICKRARALELSCQVVTAKGLGHSYTEPLPSMARRAFEELIGSDKRW